jgi:acylglycerol lipase
MLVALKTDKMNTSTTFIPLLLFVLMGCSCVPVATKPPALPENYNPEYIVSRDGVKLYYKQYLPDAAIAGVVLVAPGIGGIRSNDCDELGYYLSRAGYVVLVIHDRGTGYSEGVRGDIRDYQLVIEDFESFFETTRNTYPDKPLFLLGHSLGGVTSIRIARDLGDKIRGVVMINPAYRYSKQSGPSFLTYVTYGFNALFRPSALTVDMMSGEPGESIQPQDKEEFIARKNDPLIVKKFSMRYMMSIRNIMIKAKENAEFVDKPLLMIYGKMDPYIDHSGSEEIFEAWKCSKKKKVILQEAGHGTYVANMSKDVILEWLNGII